MKYQLLMGITVAAVCIMPNVAHEIIWISADLPQNY